MKTRLLEAERNRPKELANQPTEITPQQAEILQYLQQSINAGISPQQVAEILFRGIEDEKLYIGTHPDLVPRVQARMDAIMKSIG